MGQPGKRKFKAQRRDGILPSIVQFVLNPTTEEPVIETIEKPQERGDFHSKIESGF